MESTFQCLKKKNVGLKFRMKRSEQARRRMAAMRSGESPGKRTERLKRQIVYEFRSLTRRGWRKYIAYRERQNKIDCCR